MAKTEKAIPSKKTSNPDSISGSRSASQSNALGGERKESGPAKRSGSVTRLYITELFVRLLALWLGFDAVAGAISYLPRVIAELHSAMTSFESLVYVGIIIIAAIVLVGISVLMIINSEKISRFVWAGREEKGESQSISGAGDFFLPIISGLGVYFAVWSLSGLLADGIQLVFEQVNAYDVSAIDGYNIAPLAEDIVMLIFGIVLFAFPETVVRIKDILRDVFHREEEESGGTEE